MKTQDLKNILLGMKELSQKEQVLCLYSIIKQLLNSQSSCFRTSFLLENFISKDIEFLLSLLESPTTPIRKLSLFFICLVCQNPLSKTYLMEKCGLSLIVGKFLLTRLKFIQKWSHDEMSSLLTMNKIMSKLKSYPNISLNTIFFSIPLNIELQKMPRDFRPKILEFNIKDFIFKNSQRKLEDLLKIIPDPVFNLCGMDLLHEDVHAVVSEKSKINQDFQLVNGKKKQRNSHLQNLITSEKSHNDKFNQSTQSTIHKSSHSNSNFQEIKSLILNQRSKNNKGGRISLLNKHKLKTDNKNKAYGALPLKISSTYKKKPIKIPKSSQNNNLMTTSHHSTTNPHQSKSKNSAIMIKKKTRHTVKAPNSTNIKYMYNNFMKSLNNEESKKKKSKIKESNDINYINDDHQKNILIGKQSRVGNYHKYISQMESNNLKKNGKKRPFC